MVAAYEKILKLKTITSVSYDGSRKAFDAWQLQLTSLIKGTLGKEAAALIALPGQALYGYADETYDGLNEEDKEAYDILNEWLGGAIMSCLDRSKPEAVAFLTALHDEDIENAHHVMAYIERSFIVNCVHSDGRTLRLQHAPGVAPSAAPRVGPAPAGQDERGGEEGGAPRDGGSSGVL